jgi:hypothetical protein
VDEYFADGMANLQDVATALKNSKEKARREYGHCTRWLRQTWRSDIWTALSYGWTYVRGAPLWLIDSPRGDPRFQELLRKIGFKESKYIPAVASN